MYNSSFINVYLAARAFTFSLVLFSGKVPFFKQSETGDIQNCLARWLVVKTVVLELDGWSMMFNSTLHGYRALDAKLARASAI